MKVPSTAEGRHVFGFCHIYDKGALNLENKNKYVRGKGLQVSENEKKNINERKWVVFNNILNGLSWVLSPLIGLIRIIATLIYWKLDKRDLYDDQLKYYKLEIIRGVMELFGAGYLFAISDLVITALRYIPEDEIV